ncbi:RICIN domain-containing protein [Propionicimonas paludicola]|nr:RICIN domain-containing protein [Propionicimonas paludicola]
MATPLEKPVVIQPLVGADRAIDIKGSSTADRAVVQTYSANGTSAQAFTFADCDDAGWCVVKNVNSAKCWEVKGASAARGAVVQQNTCTAGTGQKWQRVSLGRGIYSVRSDIGANRWLDVRGGAAAKGTRLQVWTRNSSKAQRFRLVAAPDWRLNYDQVDETTALKVSLTDLDSLAGQWATEVSLTAKLNYGSTTMRTVTVKKALSAVGPDGSFSFDVGDYGNWTLTGEFRKGKAKVRTIPSTKVGVTASEYIIAPLTGTMPVTMFSTSLWGSGSARGAGNSIPVIAQLSRARQWDWTKLPRGVHAVPYLTATQYSNPVNGNRMIEDLAPLRAYLKDLRALDPDSVFHLYVNDYHVLAVQSLLYANRIPADNYTITLLSDGGFSYQKFAATYAQDPVTTHDRLVSEWQAAKDYAYANGTVLASLNVATAQDYIWAAVKSEPLAKWWLTRPTLLTSAGDSNVFATAVARDPQVNTLSISARLTAIKGEGDAALAEFKALYRFNDAYFAASTASGRDVMMFLGTRLENEVGFTDYAGFTMKYYGSVYDYYYKGHPATPTMFSPTKAAQLKAMKITDVDSSVAAELILFFNPEIYLSGYPSSTYLSVSDPEMAKGLFGLTKAQGLASSSPSYSIMKWFMAPKTSYSGEIAALPGDFVVEFADSVVANKGYNIALWDSANKTITYYKLVDGTYQKVAG